MSTIAEQLVHLAELARIDQKAKVTADRLEALPQPAKKADAAAAKIKSELDSVTLRKQTAEQVKRTSEAEVQDERHKIKKWDARANDLRGEREHTALSSEIGGAKRHIRALEDVILEQMEAIEAADKDLATLTKKHEGALAEAKGEWQKVEGDLAMLKQEVSAASVARSALLAKLPAGVVKRYELIAAKKQGVGVAIINVSDVCGACNRAVPPQLCIQVMKGQVLETCPACNRLLVHHSMTRAADGADAGATNG